MFIGASLSKMTSYVNRIVSPCKHSTVQCKVLSTTFKVAEVVSHMLKCTSATSEMIAALLSIVVIQYSKESLHLHDTSLVPTPAFVSQLWRKAHFLHSCETKAGVGRTGNEANIILNGLDNRQLYTTQQLLDVGDSFMYSTALYALSYT